MENEVKTNEEVVNEVIGQDSNIEIATNLNISEEVIGIIAGLATTEVDGIAGISLGFVDGINQFLGSNKKYSKGVKVTLDGKKVVIDLFVNVKYGVRIPDVAWETQNNVKKSVETMTGLEVSAVNINVQGIIFDKPEKNKQEVTEEKTEEKGE